MLVFDRKKGRLIEKTFSRATLNTQFAIITAFQIQESRLNRQNVEGYFDGDLMKG